MCSVNVVSVAKPTLRLKDISMNMAREFLKNFEEARNCRIKLFNIAKTFGRLRVVAQKKGEKPPRYALYHYCDKNSVSRRLEVMINYLYQIGERFHKCGIEKEVFKAVQKHWHKMWHDGVHHGVEYIFPYDFEKVTSFHRVSGSSVISDGVLHVCVRCAIQDTESGKSLYVPVDIYEPWQCFKFSEATSKEQKYFATVFSMLTLYGC